MRTLALISVISTLAISVFSAPTTWNGNVATWQTPSEWTPAQVPDIGSGTDTAAIGAGTVTYVAGGDWQNNSLVLLSNDATWVQSGAISYIAIAGFAGGTGILELNGNATFDSGSAGRVLAAWGDGSTGTVHVIDRATLTIGAVDGFDIGFTGGSATVNVNDSATLDASGNLVIASEGSDAALRTTGILDINGGSVTCAELWFTSYDPDNDSYGENTYGRVKISGGTLEIGGVLWFWNVDARFTSIYDHAIDFDGTAGSIITRGPVKYNAGGGLGWNPAVSWETVYNDGRLLRNGGQEGRFGNNFVDVDLGGGVRELKLATPIVWDGGVGNWATAINWDPDGVPDVNGGCGTVFITNGVVTYVAGADWKNNSHVILSNAATWVQSGAVAFMSIAGYGNGNSGILELNNNATFSSGSSGLMMAGWDGGTGTVNVNDNATLTSNGAEFDAGRGGGASGTVNVNDFANFYVGNWLYVGREGAGTLNLNDSATNTATGVIVGSVSGGTGTLNINSHATLNAGGDGVRVGHNGGTGTLNINDHTTLTDSGELLVGTETGSTGTVHIAGHATLNIGAGKECRIGDRGLGIVNVNDHATLDVSGSKITLGIYANQNSRGILDINGGTVTCKELWMSWGDTGGDGFGENTYGRVKLSGGTLEVADVIWFWNTSYPNTINDQRIDFDGTGGSIITRGALRTEWANFAWADRTWEWLFDNGYLLRNGANSGSFGDHFFVVDLGNGDRELRLIPKGTVILIM